MCYLLYYSMRDELSKSVSISTVACLEQELCIRKVYTQSSIQEYPAFKHGYMRFFHQNNPIMLYANLKQFSYWF